MKCAHGIVGGLAVAALLAGCSSGSGSAPRGSPVPGTNAFVGNNTVGPLHVGELVGRLKKVDGTCRGSYGTGGTSNWSVTLYTDKQCRVYVSAITPPGGTNGGPPSGGSVVPPSPAP
jgi:hypothetical protein